MNRSRDWKQGTKLGFFLFKHFWISLQSSGSLPREFPYFSTRQRQKSLNHNPQLKLFNQYHGIFAVLVLALQIHLARHQSTSFRWTEYLIACACSSCWCWRGSNSVAQNKARAKDNKTIKYNPHQRGQIHTPSSSSASASQTRHIHIT